MPSFALPVSPLRFAWLKVSLFVLPLSSLLLPTPVSAQQTFTGGAIAVGRTQTTASSSAITIASPTGSSIATIKIVLNGVTSDGSACADGNCWSMGITSFYLQAPNGGPKLVLLGGTGDTIDGDDQEDSGSGLSNVDITIQDGASSAPNGTPWQHTGSVTVEPSSYYLADGQTPPLGSAADWPQSDGNATLSSRFAGLGINNGDQWTLTIENGEGLTTPINISSWEMVVTYASTTPTSTVASSNLNPAFTTSPSNSVTLTATVSPASGPTGTVAFTDNGATISGCGAVLLSGGVAHCSTTFAQGYHPIDAAYSGGGGYGQSSGSLTQLVEVHPTRSSNTWCNNTSFSAPLNGTPIAYPAMIPVSGYGAGSTVGNVTLELESVTQGAAGTGIDAEFLLVAPGGAHNLDFLDTAFNTEGSGVNLFISDASSLSPDYGTAVSNDTYLPFDGNTQTVDTFPASNSPIVDSSIPSVPGTINFAAPHGKTNAFTLQQAFSGAPADGDWALYATASNGTDALTVGGWCITLDVNSGVGTTTSLSSTQQDAFAGTNVTLTATVQVQGTSSPVTSGTVEFKDLTTGNVLAAAVALNGSGVAAVTTSTLAEGDHKIIATYAGTGSFNTSFQTMYQRIDDATAVTQVSSNSWRLCNTGTITLPMGTSGAETPNPSNIFVSNLPGTLNTATLSLNNFSILVGDQLDNTESLVVGPTGAALDFFSNTADGTIEDQADAGTYTFADSASGLVPSGSGNLNPGTYKPTSYVGTDNANDVFTADPGGFLALPGTFGYSASRGTATFESEFGNTNPVGTWSLYFNSPNANANGTGAAGGWCLNLTENLPTISTPDLSHIGTFAQGESNAQYTVAITNSGTTGPTGDPTGTNPMTVTDVLNPAFTFASGSGTGWSCSASGQTVTCTNDSAVADGGGAYPTLTINVNVSATASGSINNQITAGGAGASNVTSNVETVLIELPPAITSAASTTFTSGTLGSFTVTTSGSPTPALSEIGSLPPGVVFTDLGNGTAVIAGTASLAASYPITITAQNGASPNATQSFTLTVNPGAATHLVIPGGPEPFYTAFGFTITAEDAAGNVATSYEGTVAFTSSDPGFVNLGPVTLTNGQGSQSGVLKTAGTDSITATDTVNPSITGTGFFTIQPGVATRIGVSAPSSAYVGSPFSYTLTAYDLYGNVATSYGGTVVFSSSDPSAILPGSSAISNGTGTFSATMETAGTQTITATDAGNSLAATSGNISVTIPPLVVTTADDDAGTAGNCTIQTTPGTGTDASCSLRDALLFAASEGSGGVTFDSTAFASAQTITLSNGTLTIPASTTILGPTTGTGATLTNLVTVNGAAASSVFTVNSGVTGAAVANLIVTNGSTGASGGGINNAGTLTVTNSTITNNAAGGGFGGGINNAGTLTVAGSTISANSATTGQGSGIFNNGALTVTNSTIAGNAAAGGVGGGIMNAGSGTLTVTNSTISGNSAAGGGGIYGVGTTVNLANSIVSGNPGDADIDGGFTDNGGNQVGVGAINLAPLANYGGPMRTMPALPGSPAICAGTLTNWNAASLTADQRGFGLLSTYCPAGSVDSGAVQTNYALAFTTQPPASSIVGQALSPAPVVGLTESLVVATAATSPITMSGSPYFLDGTTVGNLASGSATFTNLVVSQLSSDELLTATLSMNASRQLNLTAQSSTAVSTTAIGIALTASGSTLAGPVETFTWTAVPGAASYVLWLGTTGVGSNNLWSSATTTATSVTFGGLPTDGEAIYARLWVITVNGALQHSDYTFTAATRAALTAPAPGATLNGSSASFTWSAGVNAVSYDLWLGTTGVGSNNIWGSGITTATSVTFGGLPTNGQTIYARLFTYFNGGVAYSDFTYAAMPKAMLTAPAPGGILPGPRATFQWTAPAGATAYDLWLGTTGVGSNNLWSSGTTAATSITFGGLPTNGQAIYARLFTYFNGGSGFIDYTYTATTPAEITSPSPNSTFTGASETFQWTTVSSALRYSIWVGSSVGMNDLGFTAGGTTSTSFTLNTLPTNGEAVYVRLWTIYPDGGLAFIDYTFTAF